jgi:ring-1,2-phenylacetyl-CoA epoxidase subunit PaaC
VDAVLNRAKFDYLLRQGDSALVLAQSLCALCGKGPALEEDIAIANVALDLLGQARLWLGYAGEVEGRGRDENRLAYLRDARAYRNLLLVEQPNGDYAHTMTRQFLFDAWHVFLLRGLTDSPDARIAAIAGKSVKEATYHLRRSGDLVVRLGDGTPLSHAKMQAALDDLWTWAGEAFLYDDVDLAMVEQGIAPPAAALRSAWLAHVGAVLRDATLAMPDPDAFMQRGGKQGRHTERLGYLLAEMQCLQRAYPEAAW